MASPGKQLPRFAWSELAVVELLRALKGTARAFLLGEFSEDNNDATVRVDSALPFPANLRPDDLMSVRDWQLLNEEVKRLSGRGLVGICRIASVDADGGTIADRKILDKYGAFGVRLLAVIDPEEVSQAVANAIDRPNALGPTLIDPVDWDLTENVSVEAAPETDVIGPPVELHAPVPSWKEETAAPVEAQLARTAVASATFASTIALPIVPPPPTGLETEYRAKGVSLPPVAVPAPAPVAAVAIEDEIVAFEPEEEVELTAVSPAPAEEAPVEHVEKVVSLPEISPSALQHVEKKSSMTKVAAGIAAVLVCGVGIWAVASKEGTPAIKRPPPSPVSTRAVPPEVVSEPVRSIAVQKDKAVPATVTKAVVVKPVPRPVEPVKAAAVNDNRRKAPVTAAVDAGAAQKAKREAALRALDQQ